MFIIEPPKDTVRYSKDKIRARISCDTSRRGTVIPLAFPIFLIGMCTIYAIKTRNLPQNFNEAKFIGFTMYTTCVLWLAVIPVYLSGYETEMVLTLCISVSASIALVILFFPKTYIILCRPEKNSRASYATAKDIRCHIGVLQTNVHPKVRKNKFWKKSNNCDPRESSAFTEVVEIGAEKRAAPRSPPLSSTKLNNLDRITEHMMTEDKRNSMLSNRNRGAVSPGSANSVQFVLEGSQLRRSFIRREKQKHSSQPDKPTHKEEMCQTEWTLPPGNDLELAEAEEFSTASETDIPLSELSLL
ncbi:unnamed protein product [Rodentolepis nana]|uniref:G_PROTEIN_RECEP_F3_4 domain-containing protein n=1 Tax=Rodentolepis nana TaxID=102285 RepID=A0A0R3T5Y6_RODNA|nr:unnamed protein product [Rodentolepis nana]